MTTSSKSYTDQMQQLEQESYLTSTTFKKNKKLATRIESVAAKNFTNRCLVATLHLQEMAESKKEARQYVEPYGPLILRELTRNPQKPSGRLATLATTGYFSNQEVASLIEMATPETTKAELKEFFETRENWSTGLRMIDYINHHVVLGMTRHLPEKDRLDLWHIKPELIDGTDVGISLAQLSPSAQKVLLNEIENPNIRAHVRETIKNPPRFIHFSTMFGGGNLDPKTIEIPANFVDIRERRICSHEDNRRFFPAQEHFRSSY